MSKYVNSRLRALATYLDFPELWRFRRTGVQIELFRALRVRWLQALGIKHVLDVGANEGQFAVTAAAAFPDAEIHSFEPLEKPLARLRRLSAANPRIRVHPMALGAFSGQLEFEENEYSPASSALPLAAAHKQMFPHAVKTAKRTVPVSTLDEQSRPFWSGDAGPLMVKIDTQGYEGEVIAGGGECLKRTAVVICECSFERMYENQPLFEEVAARLASLGLRYRGELSGGSEKAQKKPAFADCIFARE